MENTKYTPEQAEALYQQLIDLLDDGVLGTTFKLDHFEIKCVGDNSTWWLNVIDCEISRVAIEGIICAWIMKRTHYPQAKKMYREFRKSLKLEDSTKMHRVGVIRYMFSHKYDPKDPHEYGFYWSPVGGLVDVNEAYLDKKVKKLLGLA